MKVTSPDVTPRLLPWEQRHDARHKCSSADRFAITVDNLELLLENATTIHSANIAEIRRYPEAVAMADQLEQYAADLRRLASLVKNGGRPCASCGGPVGSRADARYCSATCWQRGHRSRRDNGATDAAVTEGIA